MAPFAVSITRPQQEHRPARTGLPQIKNRDDEFQRLLLAWYRTDGRHHLPWRHTADAYHILVSELMLQQTQVPRVIPKYTAFLARFPTLRALADAPRTDVLSHWQGLGYNSRAIRLHDLAKATARTGLPRDRDALLALPGIGPYTAGAVRIFAHDLPDTSVDVNVRRVLARVFFPPRRIPAAAQIEALQTRLSNSATSPRDFHSALMDLGATVCTARAPSCNSCPLRGICSTVGERPDERGPVSKRAAPARFHGSNRWWRGRVLRELLRGPQDPTRLALRILPGATAAQRTACGIAVEELIAEGIAARSRGRVRIREHQ